MTLDGKTKILEAARRVISQYGSNRATLRSIAEEAGMSTGAIYHYYKNKNEVLYDVLDESLSDSSRIAKEVGKEDVDTNKLIKEIINKTEERLRKEAENRLQHQFAHEVLSGNKDLQIKLHEKYREWNGGIEEILKSLYGLEDPTLNKALSSWLLGAVDGVVLQFLLEVNDNEVEDMMEIFELLLEDGLPQFIKLLNSKK